jgi:predicted metal-binding membrane protein
MLLLFVGGVMNLLWIAAITVFVLVEKLLPHGSRVGPLVGPLSGLALVIAGVWVFASA